MSAQADRSAGGRGRRRGASAARNAESTASAGNAESSERTESAAPRAGAKRTVMDAIRQIPDYLRLLGGLLRDRRVSWVDKALVIGAIAYVVSPADFIPDFIPFLGQVDDIFLLMASIERLIRHAGRPVILAHWKGDPSEISISHLEQVLLAATFFLPRRIRRRIKRRVLG